MNSKSDKEIFLKYMSCKMKLQHFTNLKNNFRYFSKCTLKNELFVNESDDELTFNEDNIKKAELEYHIIKSIIDEREQKKFNARNDQADVICSYCDISNSSTLDKCYVCGAELNFGKTILPNDGKVGDEMAPDYGGGSIENNACVSGDNCMDIDNLEIINENHLKFSSHNLKDTVEMESEYYSEGNKHMGNSNWVCVNGGDPSFEMNEEEVSIGYFDYLRSRKNACTNDTLELYQWKCDKCDCLNTFNQINCGACHKNISKKCQWQCQHCSYLNRIDASKCKVCCKVNEIVSNNSGCHLM